MWKITCKSHNLIGYTFEVDKTIIELQDVITKPSKCKWFIDGYVQSRRGSHVTISFKKTSELLDYLFKLYSDCFIDHIKGNFIIIQLFEQNFKVYSDRFGVKKFFYYHNNNSCIFSDDLHEVIKFSRAKPSIISISLYSLVYHFTAGRTLFENVYHNLPGSFYNYHRGELRIRSYWKPEGLLNLPKYNIQVADIVSLLREIIVICINGREKDKLSLSLTGGSDTRNLLSLFLSLSLKPHLYTYGNPLSNDCVKALKISQNLKLSHSIYDIRMGSNIFETYAKKIIMQSGGLASIHRVHRLMAVEKERKYANSMFLGTMGGEFVRGVSEDDYIISSFVYDNWENQSIANTFLQNFLIKKCIRFNPHLLFEISNILYEEPYMKGSPLIRKFNSLSYITAHLHDAQDVNLYANIMDNVYTPFLDIDYLELLFSSQYSFDYKEYIPNDLLRRISNPIYSARFLQESYKPLIKYKYSGEHRPSEVLFNKYIAAVLKYLRKSLYRTYPTNFPLDSWMEQFVNRNLPVCMDYPILTEAFNINDLLFQMKSARNRPIESYWLKFTNPIMMRFILDEFSET